MNNFYNELFLNLAERFCFGTNKSRKVCKLVPLFLAISNGNQTLN